MSLPVSPDTLADLEAVLAERSSPAEQFNILASATAAKLGLPIGTIPDAAIDAWNSAKPGQELQAFFKLAPQNALLFGNMPSDGTPQADNDSTPEI